MTITRLTFRLHRFELLAVAIAAAALAVAALIVRMRLEAIGVAPACLVTGALHAGLAAPSAGCAEPLMRFVEIDRREVAPLFAIMLVFPILAGLLVGVPAVSREVERGTAPLPWTLDGSRRHWLATRLAILAAVLLISFVPLALATDSLEAARSPLVDPAASFGDEGVRGVVLIARALAGFAIGALAGLVLGRQLPGLIAGILLGAAVLVGLTVAIDAWSAAVAVVRPVDAARVGDRAIATRLRGQAGTLYTFAQVDAMQPPRPDLPPGAVDEQWIQAHFEEVSLLVPGDRYPQAVALQLAILLGGSSGLVAGSLVAIERRRPA